MIDDGIEVTVDWALRTRQGAIFEMTAGGGWVARRDYEGLIAPWLPVYASAPMPDGAPRCLWVAPGLGPADPDTGLGVAVTTPGPGGAAARADETVYLHFRWDDVAKAQPTYAALADAALFWADELAKDPQPTGEVHPFRVTLPPSNPRRLALLIRRLGLKRVAAAAALVLQGQVTLLAPPPRRVDGVVVRTDGDIRTGLEWFDAVAALLPYGYRAGLSLSTWAVPGAMHRLRFANQGDLQVAVDPAAVLPVLRGVAARYHRTLVELDARHLLDEVVAHLAAHHEIRLEDDPKTALGELHDLDRPHQVWRAFVERGEVDVDRIRAVLDDPKLRVKVRPSSVRDLARALLMRLDPQDGERLATHLEPSQLLDLVEAVDEVLRSDQEPPQVAWLLSVAGGVGVTEDLLDELLRPSPRFFRWRDQRKRDRVLPLVADALDPPDPAAWVVLRSTVRDNPLLAYDIVERQLMSTRGVVAAMRTTAWLTAGPDPVPKELALLDELVRGDADTAAVEIARRTWPPDLAGRLTKVKRAHGHPGRLEVLWARQHAGGEHRVAERAELESLVEEGAPVVDIVRLDLLGLLGDGRPLRDLDRRLAPSVGADSVGDYATTFAGWFWSLTDDDRWTAARRIAEHLNGLAWADDSARAAATIRFLHRLKTPPAGHGGRSWNPQHFVDTVALGAAGNPELEHLEAYRTLWLGDDGEDGHDGTVPPQPSDPYVLVTRLGRMGDDLDLATFVTRAATILRFDDPKVTDALFAALRSSRHLATGLAIHDFLILVWQKVHPPETDDHDEAYWALERRVHRGSLGDDAARSFSAYIRRVGPAEFRRWSQELFEAGMSQEDIRRHLHDVADESRWRGQPSDPDEPEDADDTWEDT